MTTRGNGRARSGSVLVSVVIPTHNRESVVNRSIRSALAQTHYNLEVIVVDDGSTDGTADLLRSYRDERVRVLTLATNEGASAARNRGIEEAKGRYVGFLDSDDEWLPTKVQRQILAFEGAEEPALVYTGMWKQNGSTRSADVARANGRAFEQILGLAGPITTSGIMVDTERARNDLYFDESFPAFQDRDLLIRVSRDHTITRVPEPLYIWHQHPNGRITEDGRHIQARQMLIEKYHDDLFHRPQLAAFHYFRLALVQSRAGDAVGARASIRAAAKLDDSSWRLKLLGSIAAAGSVPSRVALKSYAALGRMKRNHSHS